MADRSVVTERVARAPETGCLEWQGALSSNGYGRLVVDGRSLSTHRVAYEIHRGPIPAGMCVLHACDNRRCVNPDHLRIGTHAENSREMVDRGRYKGPSRLSPDDRAAIRRRFAAGELQRVIAADYGVCQATVSNVVRGKTS